MNPQQREQVMIALLGVAGLVSQEQRIPQARAQRQTRRKYLGSRPAGGKQMWCDRASILVETMSLDGDFFPEGEVSNGVLAFWP
jgi:hypothetical protein